MAIKHCTWNMSISQTQPSTTPDLWLTPSSEHVIKTLKYKQIQNKHDHSTWCFMIFDIGSFAFQCCACAIILNGRLCGFSPSTSVLCIKHLSAICVCSFPESPYSQIEIKLSNWNVSFFFIQNVNCSKLSYNLTIVNVLHSSSYSHDFLCLYILPTTYTYIQI